MHPRACSVLVSALTMAGVLAGCTGSGSSGSEPNEPTTTAAAEVVSEATFSGTATLDGKPITSEFLGAVVVADGLVTPCQAEIPNIQKGAFEIDVLAAPGATGCGTAGAQVVLWTYLDDVQHFATEPLDWSADGQDDAEVAFATADPQGAAPVTTGFFGSVRWPDGHVEDEGTVEAWIGDQLCGHASIRGDEETFLGYVIGILQSPDDPPCPAGAEVTFRVDGMPVATTVRNTQAGSSGQDATDLVLE